MSLTTRLTLLWSLLAAALVGLFGFLNYRGSREHVLTTWRETLEHDATTTILRVQSAAQEAARDALYLASTPGVREYALAGEGTERQEQWRRITEDEFRALMAGKPTYFQVRLLSATADGPELIRLDHLHGTIETIPAENLQAKGDRDYFQAGRQLAPGAVYVSDLTLNQDFGRVTEPHTPTVRTVASVRTADGYLFGMVVINVDLGGLVATLPDQASPGVSLQLGNEAGDYVIHPDSSRTFGRDLGRPARFAMGAGPSMAETAELAVERTFPALPGSSRLWKVRLTARESEFLRGLAAARNRALALTGLAAIGGAGVVLLAGRSLARRLQHVSDAMAHYESGQEIPTDPTPGPRDEIGRLAEKFRGLAAKVRDDVAALEAARHEAEAAARARDDFLAMMSHEIRTPMNAVTGLLRVLERNRPAPHQEPVLASLRSASRQLLALLDEALDHSKIKAGRVTFQAIDFSLHELLRDSALTHRPLAAQKGLAFELTVADNLPDSLRGDAVRLGQVLNNLLGNAVKFTDHGSVRLEARLAQPDGQPDANTDANTDAADTAADTLAVPAWIEFIVSDTGIGIAEEDVGRIFAPFDQAHGDIGRRFGGTGLGLSIVRSLVELQGGTLSMVSQPGQGSCFRACLPFQAAPAAGPFLEASHDPPANFQNLHFLYVEDVASNREVMAATLSATGARLECAETGAAALATMDRCGSFDLVLVDLQLPDMNGLELARRLHARHPRQRLVAVTAQVSAETRADCLAAGLLGVVTKPYTPASLFSEMVRWLPAPPPVDPHVATTTPDPDVPVAPVLSPSPRRPATSMPPAAAPAATPAATPPSTPPCPAAALHVLFPDEPARVQRLLHTLTEEFAQHTTTFHQAAADNNLDALRALRHKLHSALTQLRLEALRHAFDAFLETPDQEAARTLTARELDRAAASLRQAAARHNEPEPLPPPL
jgi:signal transduction histidine kinase/HPt (histidine-containing phosphotransfer) domain-containing protein